MRQKADGNTSILTDFLVRKPFVVFTLYTGICVLALTALSWHHSKDIRESTALKAAEAYSQSVSAMRAFYSRHVVPRAQKAGATVSHDYKNSETTIPFPATLTIDLANELRAKNSAFTFNFYSDEPFPWRRERVLDVFERDALGILKGKTEQKVVRYENYNGQRSVRVAYPVVMAETCVACHNAHPLSPRTDWKVGDIRGVQQITLPLADVGTSFLPDMRKSAAYIAIFALAGLILIWLLLREVQSRIEQTRKLAADAELRNIELAAAKAEAERANRAQGELIANVSHELRTPLNSVIGFSEILKDERMGPMGSPEYPEFAGEIHSSGTQLLEIINSILYMSQLESGSAEMQQEILSLDKELNTNVQAFKAAADAHEVSLKPMIMPDLPPVLFDRNALSRIIHCILDNAIKFTEPGGKVWVAARELGDGGIEIRFKDTGAGIASDVLLEVLKPFRQADGARSRRFEGVGLGLAMANSIAKLHNTIIYLESIEGVGTTVVLTIPANRVVRDNATTRNKDADNGTDSAIAA
ncbi:MAG: signal transduction histidine kinase [Paracoccaceae bacterium]|jgi:signal transduction histidine kinase